jgi:hypothetical protein
MDFYEKLNSRSCQDRSFKPELNASCLETLNINAFGDGDNVLVNLGNYV